MFDLSAENNEILDTVGSYRFVRVKLETGSKLVITSGGDNPEYYCEMRTYKAAAKVWAGIHKAALKEVHDAHMDAIEALYDQIISDENNPRLPGIPAGPKKEITTASADRDPIYDEVLKFLVDYDSISDQEIKDAFNLSKSRLTSIVNELVCEGVIGLQTGVADLDPDQHPVFLNATEDELYDKVLLYISEVETVSNGQLQKVFELSHADAAVIIDRLDAAAMISARDGNKPRQVLEKAKAGADE